MILNQRAHVFDRNQDQIEAGGEFMTRESKGFAKQTLQSIALHRAAMLLGNTHTASSLRLTIGQSEDEQSLIGGFALPVVNSAKLSTRFETQMFRKGEAS